MDTIRLSKSRISWKEIAAVVRVLRTGYLGMGKEVFLFEKELEKFFGRSVLCVNTGTSALQLSCQAIGLQSGDEVLVQSLTYVANYQAIAATGANPISCDINPETLGIDLDDAKSKLTDKTKAIMPVLIAGNPKGLNEVYKFAKENSLRIIEDASHAFGSKYKGRLVGSSGDITCISLDGIKNITSGEGGIIISDDQKIIESIRDLRLLGVKKDSEKRYAGKRSIDFDVVDQGWRYHMSDIMAAIGRVQLGKLPKLKNRRQLIARYYQNNIKLEYLLNPKLNFSQIVPHVFIIKMNSHEQRERLKTVFKKHSVEFGCHYKPNHLLTKFNDPELDYSELSNTMDHYLRAITIPLHPGLKISETKKIIQIINEI